MTWVGRPVRLLFLLSALCVVQACGDEEDEPSSGGGDDAGPIGEEDGEADAGAEADAEAPVVEGARIKITDGELEGALSAEGKVRHFFGIPYAKPPLGALRWKAPEKNAAWDGVRDAKAFAGRCAQPATVVSAKTANEDCLYLNVWAPNESKGKAPVMVWIHGGYNITGSASDPVPAGSGNHFDGETLASRHGVVVVTINYRLGAMGFFAHPQLAQEGSPLGNHGILDQRQALAWVHENIAAFGGDTENVTIFGESAGSHDVCLQVVLGNEGGLFHKAISQSGGCTIKLPTASDMKPASDAFVAAMGCSSAADVLECMRAKPAEELTVVPPNDNAPASPLPGGSQYQGAKARWNWYPVIDGKLLTEQPRARFEQGKVAKVPYLLGSTTDEGTLFHYGAAPVKDATEYSAALTRRFGTFAAQVEAVYPATTFATAQETLERVTGDVGLVCPTLDSARRAAKAGLPVRMYNFDMPMGTSALAFLKAGHGAEILYIFGSSAITDPGQIEVSKVVQGYWARFAATGDPNGGGAAAWPAFDASNDLRINLNAKYETVRDFRKSQCDLFSPYYDKSF